MATEHPRPRGKKKSIDLPTLIDLFIASKEVEGRSKRTTDWYRANLHAFSEFLGQGDVASADELSLAAVRLAHQQTDRAAIDHGSIARHEDAAVPLSQMQVASCDRDIAQAFRGRNITAGNYSTDQAVAHRSVLMSRHVAS